MVKKTAPNKIYEWPINPWIDAQNNYSSGKYKLKP